MYPCASSAQRGGGAPACAARCAGHSSVPARRSPAALGKDTVSSRSIAAARVRRRAGGRGAAALAAAGALLLLLLARDVAAAGKPLPRSSSMWGEVDGHRRDGSQGSELLNISATLETPRHLALPSGECFK